MGIFFTNEEKELIKKYQDGKQASPEEFEKLIDIHKRFINGVFEFGFLTRTVKISKAGKAYLKLD